MANKRDSNAELPDLINWLSALGDSTRLRIMRLLREEELGVGELSRVVQLPQSTVSRHLKVLHEVSWVAKRPVGTSSLYRLVVDRFEPDAVKLWKVANERLNATRSFAGDEARLREVLVDRQTSSREFFGRVSGEWNKLRGELFGERFTASALLAIVDPNWVVADIGCGTGEAAQHLAPLVKKIIAIDREPAMLEAAKSRLAGLENVDFREGEIANLPLKDGECDAALLFLVLHHLENSDDAIAEIARTLRPGGLLVVLDMVAHTREVYRHTMGHVHLGFSEEALRKMAEKTTLNLRSVTHLRPDVEGTGPQLFVATFQQES